MVMCTGAISSQDRTGTKRRSPTTTSRKSYFRRYVNHAVRKLVNILCKRLAKRYAKDESTVVVCCYDVFRSKKRICTFCCSTVAQTDTKRRAQASKGEHISVRAHLTILQLYNIVVSNTVVTVAAAAP